MKKINSSQRSYLKSLAHHYKPIINIGKVGINEGVLKSIDIVLDSRELIKIKFNDFKQEKNQLTTKISKKLKCHIIGIIGHTVILFRKNPNTTKSKFLEMS